MNKYDDGELSQPSRDFVDRMGIRFEADGLPRIAGQTFGLMLLSRVPRSLDSIAQTLQVSKASASSNARLLERVGLLVRTALPADRRDYYHVAEDMERQLVEHRLAAMRAFKEVLDRGMETPEAADEGVHRRLEMLTRGLGCVMEDMIVRARKRGIEGL